MIPGTTASRGRPPTGAPSLIAGVRFNNLDSSTGLNVASQSVANSYFCSMSMFFRPNTTSFDQCLVKLGDASANFLNNIFLRSGGGLSADFTNSGGGTLFEPIINESPVIEGSYNHLLFSVDLNHVVGAKIANFVVNGVVCTINTGASTDGDAAFQAGFNGGEFGLPDQSSQLGGTDYMDYQEVWIALGQYVDPSDIALFRDPGTGLPVDLGSDGSTPTGTAPTYYFRGDASTFATNLGTGATPTLTGTLTNAP